jgi:hypothetical protein
MSSSTPAGLGVGKQLGTRCHRLAAKPPRCRTAGHRDRSVAADAPYLVGVGVRFYQQPLGITNHTGVATPSRHVGMS